jgi:hypothetical protein
VAISTSPDVGALFEATGHLLPQVNVALTALGGIASSGVSLNLDASAYSQASTSAAPPVRRRNSIAALLAASKRSAESAQTCVTTNTALTAGISAQGSFMGLFDKPTGTSLFDKSSPLPEVGP